MAFICDFSIKNVSSIIKCANCFFLYARHYIGTKQKPHDHLFQKPYQPWTRSYGSNIYEHLVRKMAFCFCTMQNSLSFAAPTFERNGHGAFVRCYYSVWHIRRRYLLILWYRNRFCWTATVKLHSQFSLFNAKHLSPPLLRFLKYMVMGLLFDAIIVPGI